MGYKSWLFKDRLNNVLCHVDLNVYGDRNRYFRGALAVARLFGGLRQVERKINAVFEFDGHMTVLDMLHLRVGKCYVGEVEFPGGYAVLLVGRGKPVDFSMRLRPLS